jgi:F0F1-type ATP synthase assembly protein I
MTFSTFLAISFSLCLQFVVRIAFTILIGYSIDRFLGTFPCMMILSIIPGGYLGWLSLMKVKVKKENK